MQKVIQFNNLKKADLIVDALYKGDNIGDIRDDPLSKLLGCDNQGGFRFVGRKKGIVLYTSLIDPDWPDFLDEQTGQFTYFGDNKRPGHLIHETPKGGNKILKDTFESLHTNNRREIPPFFVFAKADIGRDVIFKGLAVPGAPGLSPTEDLIGIWKSKKSQRFQNYKAIFSILDVPIIKRDWINDIISGNVNSNNCPKVWMNWVNKGIYVSLKAKKTVEYRTKEDQIPKNKTDMSIINCIYNHFKNKPHNFEKCAAELIRYMDNNVVSCDVTRPWLDGGRDAIGNYRIGQKENSISVKFAIEAKCYNISNGVGIKETSRLISRLRYRQFGALVTTSYVQRQAYKEIVEDQHPVIIICSKDIINILKQSGYSTIADVKKWLKSNFN